MAFIYSGSYSQKRVFSLSLDVRKMEPRRHVLANQDEKKKKNPTRNCETHKKAGSHLIVALISNLTQNPFSERNYRRLNFFYSFRLINSKALTFLLSIRWYLGRFIFQ